MSKKILSNCKQATLLVMTLIVLITLTLILQSCSVKEAFDDGNFNSAVSNEEISVIALEESLEFDFEIRVALDEVYEMTMNYDPRLEPFIQEFFVQINSIIQGFYNALRFNDVSYVEEYLSSNIVIVENGNANNVSLISWIFNFIENDEALRSYLSILEQGGEQPLRRATYFVNMYKCEFFGNRVSFSALYNDDGGAYSPEYLGLWTDDFPNIFFVFETTITDSLIDPGWHFVTHGIFLSLENLQFRIFAVTTDS